VSECEHLHVEGEFDFGGKVTVKDLEHAVDKLLEVNVTAATEVKHGGETLSDDTRQARVLE